MTGLFSKVTKSPDETEALGAEIAETALEYEVSFAALFGDLGAGKTALTRGIASVLAPGAQVCSPTYAIVNEYYPEKTPEAPGRFGRNDRLMPVFHFDMYRIEDEDSLDSIGFYDYERRGGFIVTEWSENIVDSLPERYLRVDLEKLSETERRISVSLVES